MGFLQKNRIFNFEFLILNLALLFFASCAKNNTPKPYGYYRITPPDTSYVPFSKAYANYPYTFALSQNAEVKPRNDVDEPYWINLYYPALDATIHCSYKPVHNNLRELTNDALDFVYRNASFANAIPEREYSHPEARGGFTDNHEWQRLQVEMSPEYEAMFAADDLRALRELLSLDPRPHYHRDEEREYGMPFMEYDVRFRVEGNVLYVLGIR